MVHCIAGDPKTPPLRTPLRTSPRTTYGPVHGLPLRTPLRTTRQIKLKTNKKKISLTACPIDHSCRRNSSFTLGKCDRPVNRPGWVQSRTQVASLHVVIFFPVAIYKRPGNLREASKLDLFCSPIKPQT